MSFLNLFGNWKQQWPRSSRLFELVHLLASIINYGFLLDNWELNYGCEAAAFLKNWATGINKWVTIEQLESGRFAFRQLQKMGFVTTSFYQKIFLFSFSLHHNTKSANSTQNHSLRLYKAVSTSVASLLYLKRHYRYSSQSVYFQNQNYFPISDGCSRRMFTTTDVLGRQRRQNRIQGTSFVCTQNPYFQGQHPPLANSIIKKL